MNQQTPLAVPVAQGGRRTIDQRRAEHAWDTVDLIAAGPGAAKEVGHARKLPARILASGLGAALAFVQAKGEAPTLVARLSNWVLSDETPVKAQAPGTQQQGPPSLLAAVVYGDVSCLRLATTETLAYLVWLNRFAEAGEAAARGGQAAAEGVG